MSDAKPIVSIIGPAIKNHHWQEFYEACCHNNTPWEIVFAGPVGQPEWPLPRLHYIRTDRKPAQCLEIAAMHARGDYLLVAPDDVLFTSESIDWAWVFRQHLPPWSVVGMRYGQVGKAEEMNDQSVAFVTDVRSPILPICGLVAKADWEAVGGVDRRYVASSADNDVFMRCRARGGQIFISPNSVCMERDAEPTLGRLVYRFEADRQFFEARWMKWIDGAMVYYTEPTTPTEPFDRATIMQEDQGNLEGWRE